jgi:hypothetical protein
MQNEFINRSDIHGHGSDLDVSQRPAYPMWEKPKDGTGAHWERPEQQPVRQEILHSIERPGITPVFGTTVPPKGLSGSIRRYAFKFSEGTFAHWFALIFADRIQVWEGIFDDLIHGHVPNIYKEMGGPAERKYNPKGFQKKAIITGLCLISIPLIVMYFARKD